VDDYVTSDEDILSVIGRNNKLNSLLISDDSPMVTVVLKLKKDESSKNGYYWSSAKGKTIDVTEGTVFQVKLITNESSPISKLLPSPDKEA
jgi:HlyD family secretion protein